jgi:hypothetical protein
MANQTDIGFEIDDLCTEVAPAATNNSVIIEIIFIYYFLPC